MGKAKERSSELLGPEGTQKFVVDAHTTELRWEILYTSRGNRVRSFLFASDSDMEMG